MAAITRRALTASSLAFFATGCAARVAQEAPPPPPPATPPDIGSFGVDLTARDLAVKPGDDFFRYCNGTWMRTTEIPADRTRWGAFDQLAAKAESDVREIVQSVAASGGAPGTNEQKIADFYNAFINTDEITAKGMASAASDLAEIAALRTHADMLRLAARPDMPVAFPLYTYMTTDDKNPNRYCVKVTQGGLGLPDREYYRRNDEEFPRIRADYEAHIARLLTLGGQTNAARKAAQIVALETQIAELHWPIERRRERDLTYNPKTRAELDALSPRYPWGAWLEGAGLADVQSFVVVELDSVGPIANLVRRTPVDTWKAYLTYHYLSNCAPVLPTPVDDENFDFYGRKLNGQPQQRDRWKRAVQSLDGAIGEAVGQLYVARHFPPNAKAQMLELVENLRRAYGQRIDQLPWMSPETKVAAREKLSTFLPKIGYPDRWRDYSALEIRAGDAFGNAKRAGVFEYERQRARLNQPTDRSEWFMTPQTVNAYYNDVFNEIVFPAAILQAPFFDPNADAAVNYGAIGGVIGHEMGHGFDDQGAKSDAYGVLRDWWNAEDVRRFTELGDKLAAQYDAFSPLPGINVNGRLTLGENIGDVGGLQVAHAAYLLHLNGATPPELEGVTGEQRFFLSWGQVWRTNIREQRLRTLILSDPHSPPEYRVNGVVRNLDAWYAAFNVAPTDRLFLAEQDRVEIW
ncbi:MAG: M13 family metallopeptidase [Hyphomonadaceae bacterium]